MLSSYGSSKEHRKRLRAVRTERRRRLRSDIARETIRACFAFIGLADGELSKAEIAYASGYFSENYSNQNTRDDISGPYTALSQHQLTHRLRSYLSSCGSSLSKRKQLIEELLRFAICDAPPTPEELTACQDIASLLHISPDVYVKLQRRVTGESTTFSDRKSTEQTDGTKRSQTKRNHQIPACYQRLGCSASDSDEAIKRAYRKLASRLHPDKHSAAVKNPDDLAKHIDEFQQLQAAYEEIWRLRKATTGRS